LNGDTEFIHAEDDGKYILFNFDGEAIIEVDDITFEAKPCTSLRLGHRTMTKIVDNALTDFPSYGYHELMEREIRNWLVASGHMMPMYYVAVEFCW